MKTGSHSCRLPYDKNTTATTSSSLLPVGRMTAIRPRAVATSRWNSAGEVCAGRYGQNLTPTGSRQHVISRKVQAAILALADSIPGQSFRRGLVARYGSAGSQFSGADTKATPMDTRQGSRKPNAKLDRLSRFNITFGTRDCQSQLCSTLHRRNRSGRLLGRTKGDDMVEAIPRDRRRRSGRPPRHSVARSLAIHSPLMSFAR